MKETQLTPVAPSPLPVQPAAPEVPADGSCFVCGKPRRPERSRQYAGVAAEFDAFCASNCARVYYNNPLPSFSIWSKPGSDRKFEAA